MGLLNRAAKSAARQFGPDDFARFFGSQVDMSPAARMARADKMFPVRAYRGMRGVHKDEYGSSTPQWFSSNADITNSYVQEGDGMNLGAAYPDGNVLPARLNLGNALEIDAAGAPYYRIPRHVIPKDILTYLDAQAGRQNSYTTDKVQFVADQLGFDSVRFRNIRDAKVVWDSHGDSVPPSDVIAINPRAAQNVRAAWATFDPARVSERDILGGLALTAGGGLLSYANRGRQY